MFVLSGALLWLIEMIKMIKKKKQSLTLTQKTQENNMVS